MLFYLLAGHISDRVGRKKPIVIGYLATLLLLFPAFWLMGARQSALAEQARRAPVTVAGPDCSFSAFSTEQSTQCGKLLADLAGSGVPYSLKTAPALTLRAGNRVLPLDAYPWADKAGAPRPCRRCWPMPV
jgi:MFS family permease